ncbi:MAG: RNA-binding protein [Candidatus Vogelbacteria bacterium CG10_big_fil_rev_8_21_14_0_10_51_16]|uniref:RNA-binding protein KhpA n=1 Tax=Candidatus Vogelbacteria bacterium CG10_big_fil_rev_8_21_14_0_10_51_16 TaxID=1975045 RepID=A0A2H0RFP0_9BACT|nr:MAG: RNA-binding protein [Candidatus Vogelbacteria bacterium CG10_big_fil_rev_8_21_14_0_10_51_16]
MSAEKDQEFLEYVIKAIVDHSEEVVVNRSVDEMGVLLTLKVHREDMGKVIGRSGNTAKAVRTLLRVVGMKYNARVNLKIEEPDGGRLAPAEGGASVPTMKTVDEAMADLQL